MLKALARWILRYDMRKLNELVDRQERAYSRLCERETATLSRALAAERQLRQLQDSVALTESKKKTLEEWNKFTRAVIENSFQLRRDLERRIFEHPNGHDPRVTEDLRRHLAAEIVADIVRRATSGATVRFAVERNQETCEDMVAVKVTTVSFTPFVYRGAFRVENW